MSICESSITNPKKQLEFYKDLSEQLQRENERLKGSLKTYEILLKTNIEENQSLKDRIDKAYEITKKLSRVSDKEHLLSCALDLSLLLKGDKE